MPLGRRVSRKGGHCDMDGRNPRAGWHAYGPAGVLLTLANEARPSSSAWCAGLGTIGDTGERCPVDVAAGQCPAGCEVASGNHDSYGDSVAMIASVVVVLAVVIAMAYIFIDLRTKAEDTAPLGHSISVDNPMIAFREGGNDELDTE
jgi:hypothetical protein